MLEAFSTITVLSCYTFSYLSSSETIGQARSQVEQFIEETVAQIKIAMLCSGASNIQELQNTELIKTS